MSTPDTKKVMAALASALTKSGGSRTLADALLQEAGEHVERVDVTREGSKIVLPENMSIDDGIAALKRRAEEEAQTVGINEPVFTYPLDGVHALMLVLERRFGWTTMGNTGWFGMTPPQMISVQTSATERKQVPWGKFMIPGVEGYLTSGVAFTDGLVHFMLRGEVKRLNQQLIKDIADETRALAKTKSLYRGKAIRVVFPDVTDETFNPVDHAPKFIDTSAVKVDELVLPRHVEAVLEASLWTPIKATAMARAAGVPLKRATLLEGTFGVGKTLTANVTALHAEANNWTFIYLQDPSQLPQAMRFAKAYEPAVVFTEDIDRTDDEGTRNEITNTILNIVDGVEMKGAEVILVATTNNVRSLAPAMLRPGRLDAIVSFEPPDGEAVQRLVRMYSRGTLAEGEDLTTVAELLKDNIPSTVREVVERSKLAAIGRLHAEGVHDIAQLRIKAVDLEVAAKGMLSHLQLLKPKDKDRRSNDEKAAQVLADGIAAAAATLAATVMVPRAVPDQQDALTRS